RRLHFQYETARILTDSSSVSEACNKILEFIGTNLNCTTGTYWEVDVHRDCLNGMQIWECNGANDMSAAALRDTRIARGGGLLGRAWATGLPQRAPDGLQETVNTSVNSGFAFATKVGPQIFGV